MCSENNLRLFLASTWQQKIRQIRTIFIVLPGGGVVMLVELLVLCAHDKMNMWAGDFEARQQKPQQTWWLYKFLGPKGNCCQGNQSQPDRFSTIYPLLHTCRASLSNILNCWRTEVLGSMYCLIDKTKQINMELVFCEGNDMSMSLPVTGLHFLSVRNATVYSVLGGSHALSTTVFLSSSTGSIPAVCWNNLSNTDWKKSYYWII